MITVMEAPTYMTITVPQDDLLQFKELIQRGANLWPDASPEIKQFADIVTSPNMPHQDHYAHASVQLKTR